MQFARSWLNFLVIMVLIAPFGANAKEATAPVDPGRSLASSAKEKKGKVKAKAKKASKAVAKGKKAEKKGKKSAIAKGKASKKRVARASHRSAMPKGNSAAKEEVPNFEVPHEQRDDLPPPKVEPQD